MRSAASAPSAHSLEMKAVERVRSELHPAAKQPRERLHTLSEVEQGSLLADAQREMKAEAQVEDGALHARGGSTARAESEARLAEDRDHGHVPLKFVKEAMQLARERDGPQAARPKPAAVQHLSKAAESSLLRKALQEQNADTAKFGKFVRTSARRAPGESDEAEDKDHGHVKLKWIKLAQKLAKEQGQSLAEYKADQKPAEEAADSTQKGVKDWQLALMKKAEQERQDDAERVEKPLAEEMVKQGYLIDPKAEKQRAERTRELAKDRTQPGVRNNLASSAQETEETVQKTEETKGRTQLHRQSSVDAYVQEVQQVEDKRAAEDKKKEKPLADEMVRQGYLRDKHVETKAEAKMKDRAMDHMLEHPNKLQDFVKEVNVAEAKRATDDARIEKPLADQMVRQGYLRDRTQVTKAQAKMKDLATDHMQQHPTKLNSYVKDVMKVKGERAADDEKEEKPLAREMVREGYLRDKHVENKAQAKMKERATDHMLEHPTKLNSYVKDVKRVEGERAADDEEEEKPLAREMVREGFLKPKARETTAFRAAAKDTTILNHKKHGMDVYLSEAMKAESERNADAKKVQKPLADEMVRQGYLRPKNVQSRVEVRAEDHTDMKKINVKEVESLGKATKHVFNAHKGPTDSTQLNHRTVKKAVDYVKEAMEAKAERDADAEKVERPLAEAMVHEGYLRKKGPTLSERAVDHTTMPHDAVKEFAAQAAKAASGQADLLKEAMQATAMKDAEDAAVEAPLAKEMVKQGYLKPHNVISAPAIRTAASKPVTAHPVIKLAPRNQPTAESKQAEAAKLLKIVDHSTWHDPGSNSARSTVAAGMHAKQTKLLNLAMKAEEGKRQDDQKTEETMMRDIKAEKQHQVRTALTMKDDVRQTRALINKAIKEQNAERAHGEAEMRLDNAALAKAKVATSNAGKSTRGNTLFDQALKEAQADRAKGRAERDQDLKAAVVGKRAESGHGPSQTLSKGSDSLIQQAIREQDDAMQKGIKEEETDNRSVSNITIDSAFLVLPSSLSVVCLSGVSLPENT